MIPEWLPSLLCQHRRTALRSVAFALCLSSAPLLAATIEHPIGGDPDPAVHAPRLQLRAVVDNDEFISPNKKDRWYSSGVRLEREDPTPPGSGLFNWPVPCQGDRPRQASWSLGHNIYTQDQRDRTAIDPADRPLAGYLYVDRAYSADSRDGWGGVALAVGVTGPAALAEPVQNGLHRLLGQARVTLWDQQLRPRLAVTLRADCHRRWHLGTRAAPTWPVVLSIGAGLAVGSLTNQASLQVSIAWGPAAAQVRPPMESRFNYPSPAIRDAWAVMAGLRLHGIATDALIDGASYGYEAQVRHRRWVAEWFAGIEWRLSSRWRLSYGVIARQRDFDTPGNVRDFKPQAIGQLILRHDF